MTKLLLATAIGAFMLFIGYGVWLAHYAQQ